MWSVIINVGDGRERCERVRTRECVGAEQKIRQLIHIFRGNFIAVVVHVILP